MATEALTFKIGADTAAFRNQMASAAKGLAGIAAAFVSVRAVTDGFSKSLEMGGHFNDLKSQTGESAGNLAILERAFDNTSVGADNAGVAIAKMQALLGDAKEEGSKAEGALSRLGLSLEDLAGKSPIEQMRILAARISGIADPTDRANAAMDIFGVKNAKLIPLLRNFSEEMETAEKQLGSLPGLLDESAGSFDNTGDRIAAIGRKGNEFAFGLWSNVIPGVESLTGKISELDAAGAGLDFGNALLGMTQKPLESIAFLGESLILVWKKFGNEMIAVYDYTGKYLFDLLGSAETWRAIADIAKNSLIVGISEAREAMMKLIEPFYNVAKVLSPALGALDVAGSMLEGSTDAARKNLEIAKTDLLVAMGDAASNTEYVRKDFLDAAGSAERIASYAAEIMDAGKTFSDSLKDGSEQATVNMDKIGKAMANAFGFTNESKWTPNAPEPTESNSPSRSGGGSGVPTLDQDNAPEKQASIRRQERADKIRGADFKSSAYGHNPDGTPRTKEEFESGKKIGRRDRMKDRIDGDANAGGNSKSGGESKLEGMLGEVRDLMKELNRKLPQQICA